MTALQIRPDQLTQIWPHVVDLISAALAKGGGEYRIEHIWANLAEGRAQLWTDGNSVCVTSVVEYPATHLLYVLVAAGELDSVPAMWEPIKEFAAVHGCSAVQFFGRPGWRRSGVMPDGWRHTHDVITVRV
jgi:hypothetical protein